MVNVLKTTYLYEDVPLVVTTTRNPGREYDVWKARHIRRLENDWDSYPPDPDTEVVTEYQSNGQAIDPPVSTGTGGAPVDTYALAQQHLADLDAMFTKFPPDSP